MLIESHVESQISVKLSNFSCLRTGQKVGRRFCNVFKNVKLKKSAHNGIFGIPTPWRICEFRETFNLKMLN